MAYIPGYLLFDVVIESPDLVQSKMGGTKDDGYTNIGTFKMAIQSVSPREMEIWQRRGVSIDHKLYTTEDISQLIKQGMRCIDNTFSPPRMYIIESPVENMGGKGDIFGVFCRLTQ
jgi:hypothetical protein